MFASVAHRLRVGYQQIRHSRPSRLWLAAIALFGVADIATTTYLVTTTPFAEGNPILATLFAEFGVWVLIPIKAVGFVFFYGLYRVVPRTWRVGVPIGLALLGCVVSVWNLSVGLTGSAPL
ncbi:hypothetical protein C488_14982 [Natrinema pellirubrum DSM 15624]|uniref:DUF5658 domain-containing protein n=1 Tax=Natrinema pellirubrum (strain DSM 15624 / CIP 106293 / JCM 10476 / NCIMB 786 / 157) TaxID=797303 RepID=L0JKH5_NATP1|nr:DUF5658 family protein [Natrinema pellirubrum]AGB31774.1 hypothetical protein Natpe_1919 [Natrinema pellirubrum DSM 15624]ELY72518.1 hypothetical protein C488_14982 [Natrinema pellirubrum DSM 15624]